MTENQLNSVGGVGDDALSIPEIEGFSRVYLPQDRNIATLAQAAVNKIEWSLSSQHDIVRMTKYPTNPHTVYVGSGAFSFNPLLGRFLFGTSANESKEAAMKLDESNGTLRSSVHNTTLGSKNIDTKDGYILNKIGAKYPSTHFTPQKTWVRKLFPSFDDNLLKISILEALQALLINEVKGTKSEQILRDSASDVGDAILADQNFQDKVINDARA